MPNWEYLQVAVSGGKWVDSTGRNGELPKVHTKNFLLHNAATRLDLSSNRSLRRHTITMLTPFTQRLLFFFGTAMTRSS